MSTAGEQPIGSAPRVVDVAVRLVEQNRFRLALLQLTALERRWGLADAAAIIAQLTHPPVDTDPRLETDAIRNIPSALPDWLERPVAEEVERICRRQSIRVETPTSLIGRILAASIVDRSVGSVDTGFAAAVAFAPHEPMSGLDLRETDADTDADWVPDTTVVDVSDGRGAVRPDGGMPIDGAGTVDWLGRSSR
ncbi:MAG: hypothetical protein JJE52_16135 [Acidimicrobiia bacterium]|nr:hypothetical protein [Acidimicrobiia bacterium]